MVSSTTVLNSMVNSTVALTVMFKTFQLLASLQVLLESVRSAQGIYPVVDVPGPGILLDKLPGTELLKGRQNLDLVMTPATIQTKAGGKTLMHLNAPVYRVKGSKKAYLFGPTLRLKAGESFNVTLQNDLINTVSNSNVQHDVGNTNFHTHGLHAGTGKYNQDPKDVTTNGDNIFLSLKGKKKSTDKASVLTLTSSLPKDHLPGVSWYHPHEHGSSTSQTYSASGLIIIEDDPSWLPDANGCGQIRRVLESAPEIPLHIQLMTFAKPASRDPWNDANIQLAAEEGNSPLCCDGNSLYGTETDVDIGFINGGWQPTIELKGGEWSRWRIAMTGYKRFTSLQILDEDDNVADCDIELIAKDALYLLQIPRKVNYILLPAGGRAEVLVRCKSTSKKLSLASGQEPLPFNVVAGGGGGMGGGGMGGGGMGGGGGGGGGGGMGSMGVDHSFKQRVLANIVVKSGDTQEDIQDKRCTPRRPDYAPDLRDANVAAAKAQNKIVYDSRATFRDSPQGCTIGGEKFSFPDPRPLTGPLGSIVEWNFFMLWNHPLHLHTNPFQIMKLPGGSLTEYFEEGDYHDTLFLPMIRGTSIPVRFQPGPYYGYSVVHCHFLQHEDAGCMKVIEWTCPAGSKGDPVTGTCSKGYIPPVKGTF